MAPWGSGVEDRPRVLTREEREEAYLGKRRRKEGRRGGRLEEGVEGEMEGGEGVGEGGR